MTFPSWLLSKTALSAGALVLALGTCGVMKHNYDKSVAQKAVVEERVRKLEADSVKQRATIKAKDDSLVVAKNHTNTVTKYVAVASGNYAAARGRVNTDPEKQPPGTPPGMVVVPVAFITTADSLAALVPQLLAAMEREREASAARIVASDSMVTILRAEAVELKIAAKNAKPSMTDKAITAGVGGAAIYLGVQLVKTLIHKRTP